MCIDVQRDELGLIRGGSVGREEMEDEWMERESVGNLSGDSWEEDGDGDGIENSSMSDSSVNSEVTVVSHWLVATSVRSFLSLVERAKDKDQEPVSLM